MPEEIYEGYRIVSEAWQDERGMWHPAARIYDKDGILVAVLRNGRMGPVDG